MTAGGDDSRSRIISVNAPISKSQSAPEIRSSCPRLSTLSSQSRRSQAFAVSFVFSSGFATKTSFGQLQSATLRDSRYWDGTTLPVRFFSRSLPAYGNTKGTYRAHDGSPPTRTPTGRWQKAFALPRDFGLAKLPRGSESRGASVAPSALTPRRGETVLLAIQDGSLLSPFLAP